MPHRAALAFHQAARALIDLQPLDVVAARSSAAYDLSVWELFAPLLAGASSLLVTEPVAVDVVRLHEALVANRATVLSTTPSAAYQLGAYDAVVGGGLALRQLLVGGEAADGARLEDVMAAPSFRTARLDNWYGPTEVTVSCTGGELDPERLSGLDLTIGPVLPGVRARVETKDGVEAAASAACGELLVAGAQLAHGYLGNSRGTAAAFVPDPDAVGGRCYRTGDLVSFDSDGWLIYHGRLDSQVQLRGYRLELSEVERVLAGHPLVRWCHAGVGGTENDVLLAWVQSAQPGLDREQLWRHLAGSLPRHAVPAALIQVRQVPVTEGQKLAVDRLPQPVADDFPAGSLPHTPPETATEQQLALIWQELLGLEDIGATYHFFALGGHSLLVARMFAQIQIEFDVELRLAEVMERLTIRELGELLDSRKAGSRADVTDIHDEPGTGEQHDSRAPGEGRNPRDTRDRQDKEPLR